MDALTRAQIKEAKANPSKVFSAPSDVLAVPGLSIRERREILESWEQEARLLQTATGENMAGGEPSRIEDVRKAIDNLSKSEK